MKALILNSGIGKRMGELTKTRNKCMAEIGTDTTIIDWQLQLLSNAGISHVVITTGPFAQNLMHYVTERYPAIDFTFCHNPEYAETNYIYSIALAAGELDDDILLMHGDLVFEESVLHDILHSRTSAMVIDSTLPLPEKDFKAVIQENRITKVGVEFFDQAYAAQPLYKLLNKDWALWLANIRKFCARGERSVYAEHAMNEISDQLELCPLDIRKILYGNRQLNRSDSRCPEDGTLFLTIGEIA